MENATPKLEAIFAQALEKPPGNERDAFVQRQCGSDAAALQEVQSLLHAHDTAGDFLNTAILSNNILSQLGNIEIPARTVIQNPAIQAQVIAATLAGSAVEDIEAQLAALPIEIRKETRERIEAVQRVRLLQPGNKSSTTESEATPDIPGFKIERKLGEGSSGTVFAAHDQKLNRKVAIKVLTRGSEEAVRRRIIEEARHAAALNDPAVATVYSVLDEADPPALVMEFIEGFSLDLFAMELNPMQKARLLREVVRGLASAHSRGLIHRDLKPDNVIVGPDLRPRILDFGLALTFEEASRQGLEFAGTPLYASPEQVQGKPLSSASDIFSFGSLMFKVLTGRPPFEGNTTLQVLEAIATTSPPFPREVALGIPADLQAICLACLAWDPVDRPSASEIHLELGRFLIGEPVRLKPKLYDDLLRRSISEYSSQAQVWMSQSIISPEERDALEVVHRRLLAEEDHWIIDARRITLLQILISGGSWLTVVAIVLMVWMMRDELGFPWRWLLPGAFSAILLSAGILAYRVRENIAAATFLAGATLAIAPCTLTLLAEIGIFSTPIQSTAQLFPKVFTNQQVLTASGITLLVSSACLWRLKMTGFAWTTAMLATATYISILLQANWLEQKIEIKALWCLPLVLMESVSLALERKGLVRWNTPFHLIAAVALVGCLDLMAWNGPTLRLCGLDGTRWPYFDETRQIALSFVVNGVLFLILARLTARAASLNLRRAGVWLEMLALVHALTALFSNAMNHRNDPGVRTDVFLYLAAAGAFLFLATVYSRWRLLVGGLLGVGLGSYLLIDLGIVQRLPFVTGLGLAGITVALGAYLYVRRRSQLHGKAKDIA